MKFNIASDILYEHEMILPETQERRVLHWFHVTIMLIGFICMVSVAVPTYTSHNDHFLWQIIMTLFLAWWLYVFVVRHIEYSFKIKVVLTEKMFLLRAPSIGYITFGGFYNLKIPNHKIVSVTVLNMRSPELKKYMNENGVFKFATNQKLYIWPYQYVFVINDCPLPYNTRFVDIGLQNNKHILFEFDDSEKFVDIFK